MGRWHHVGKQYLAPPVGAAPPLHLSRTGLTLALRYGHGMAAEDLIFKPIRIAIILAVHAIFFPLGGSEVFSFLRTANVSCSSPRVGELYARLTLSVQSRLSDDCYLAEMRHSHCTPHLLGTARCCYYTAKPLDHPQAWGPSCV